MLRSLFQRVVNVRDRELPVLLWATAYGYCILFSYYVLRAVRDDISSADRGNLQLLWTAVFLVMLVAVPLYSWVTTRMERGRFVPLANRFFIACLLAFFALLHLLPEEARPWLDRAFYVWTSVFALFVVTVFWGLVADCFDNDQGRRLFGFVAVGSSLGAIGGSALTAAVAPAVPGFGLLLISCVPLEAASWCARALHRHSGGDVEAEKREARRPPAEKAYYAGGEPSGAGGTVVADGATPQGGGTADRPLTGSAWSGIRVVFRSSYLRSIAGFLALMTFASTVLYFQQAHLVGEAIADRGARTAFYARIDLAVNVLTILFQTWLTARVIRWVGIGVSLALVPAAVCLGFVALGIYPLLAVLVVLQVAYRAGRYGLTKPAREVLFTVVSREQKYKSKAFLDAAVYRGGDLASGWIYAGLSALGLSIGAIALVAAPMAGLWALLALRLGRQQDERVEVLGRTGRLPVGLEAA